MAAITATAKLRDHELKDIPVLNPGDWFGKTWLLEIGGSYWPLFLIVEADCVPRRHRRIGRQRNLWPQHHRAGIGPRRLPGGGSALRAERPGA